MRAWIGVVKVLETGVFLSEFPTNSCVDNQTFMKLLNVVQFRCRPWRACLGFRSGGGPALSTKNS